MSVYELSYLLNEYMNSTRIDFMNFVTILSAYLAVAYFLAARLTAAMSVVVNGLFLVTCAIVIFSTYVSMASVIQTDLTLAEMARQTEGIQWRRVPFLPASTAQVAQKILTATQLIGAAGAILFFFHARKNERAAA